MIYGGTSNSTFGHTIEDNLKCNTDALLESFLFDDMMRTTGENRQAFVQSEQAQYMVEAGLIGKNTLVRLSKVDDLERRIGMAAIQIAKDNNDPLYDKLTQVRVKEKQYLDQINNKYAMKASRVAKTTQKEYLKKAPIGFMRK